jgi:protein-tyrosine phosphatase
MKDELNFRELGGYPTKNSRHVRYHLFYRSGAPCRMKKADLAYINTLHICSILDMRTKAESEKNPDPPIEGAHYIRHSGVVSRGGEDIDFSLAGMNKIGCDAWDQLARLRQYYIDMPFGSDAIQAMFDEIRRGSVPILIHCATGKDRTGVACMCLLMALGCTRETILQDYLLSNEYRKKRIQRAMDLNTDRIREHPELKELIQMKEGVSPSIGNAVLDEVERRYPDYESFLKMEYGLDEDGLNELRSRYTE